MVCTWGKKKRMCGCVCARDGKDASINWPDVVCMYGCIYVSMYAYIHVHARANANVYVCSMLTEPFFSRNEYNTTLKSTTCRRITLVYACSVLR